jgi:glycerate-2-kinase
MTPPTFSAGDAVRRCFEAGVAAVLPDRLIRENVVLRGGTLTVGGLTFDLSACRRILAVGAGKASGLMAQAFEEILGDRLDAGAVVVKYGHAAPCRRIDILEAAHPYPDEAGLEATRAIRCLCEEAGEGDLVICLWSGGGSALLADAPAGATLDEVMRLSKALVTSGAEIGEINAVRKHISAIKGGQLARLAFPAQVVSLMLSDVVGAPLDVIASGPTVADPTTFADARAVLKKYGLEADAPAALLKVLKDGEAGRIPETPKAGDPALARTANRLIGCNRIALEAAAREAQALGFEARVVTDRLEGDTATAAAQIVEQARELQARGGGKAACLLFGGETTLRVTGDGLGGRNQHLALEAARLLRGSSGITLLAAGTDGTDGPTDAAGAVADGATCARAAARGLDAEDHLRRFDAYPFFQAAGGHVKTGPTRTNVMDMVVVLVEEPA